MDNIHHLLGIDLEPKDYTILQVCSRAIIVFLVCIALVRIGDKRFLSRKTALDAVVGFILASMMARTVNGSAPMLPTFFGGLVIVLGHRLISWLCLHCHLLGRLVKGNSEIIIENGVVNEEVRKRNHISEHDLNEELRSNGSVRSAKEVKLAYFERSGDISVIKED